CCRKSLTVPAGCRSSSTTSWRACPVRRPITRSRGPHRSSRGRLRTAHTQQSDPWQPSAQCSLVVRIKGGARSRVAIHLDLRPCPPARGPAAAASNANESFRPGRRKRAGRSQSHPMLIPLILTVAVANLLIGFALSVYCQRRDTSSQVTLPVWSDQDSPLATPPQLPYPPSVELPADNADGEPGISQQWLDTFEELASTNDFVETSKPVMRLKIAAYRHRLMELDQ